MVSSGALPIGAEEALGQKSVPGRVGNDADGERETGVGAGGTVADEEIATLEVGADAVEEAVEDGRRHRPVDRAPPDFIGASGLRDEVTVLGRPAGDGTGVGGEGAGVGQKTLAAAHGPLDQGGGRELGVDLAGVMQAERGEVHFLRRRNPVQP